MPAHAPRSPRPTDPAALRRHQTRNRKGNTNRAALRATAARATALAALFLVALTLVGCHHVAVSRSPGLSGASGAEAEGDTVVLRLHAYRPPPGDTVELALALHIPAPLLPPSDAPVEFAFPTRRAGRSGFLEDIRDIQARDGDDAPLPIAAAGPGRILVRHQGRGDISLTWTLSPTNAHYADPSRFRAIANRERILAPGHAFLAQPLNLRHRDPPVRVDFTADDGLAPLSSLQASVPTVRLDAILNAVFLAGVWVRNELPCSGHILRILSPEPVPKPLGRFICDIISSQRLLHSHPSTLVVIAPRRDAISPRTGSAFDGGFLLELPPGEVLLDDDLAMLVAHEQMHRLIGHRISFAPADASATLWFLEGITDYVSLRTLVAADLLAPHHLLGRFAEAMNALAQEPYDVGEPSTSPSGRRSTAHTWTPGDEFAAQREPYDRGLLIGLLLDLALNDGAPAGARLRGLNAAIAELGQAPPANRTHLTATTLRERLTEDVAPALLPHWATIVRMDGMPPVHAALQTIGVQVTERLEPAPFFGLRVGTTAERQWYVAAVAPDSPADRAGLVAGQALASRPTLRPDRRGRHTLAVAVPTTNGQRAIILSAEDGLLRRHRLEIVDSDAFRQYLRSGRGASDR